MLRPGNDTVRGGPRRRLGHALAWMTMMMAAGGAGCAKSPTTVMTTIAADGTVPPLLLLNVTVTSYLDPARSAPSSFVSLLSGDAADRPAPYVFPLDLSVTVPSSVQGAVTVTVEGLDWTTQAVVARGTGAGTVTEGQQTRASLTLTAVSPPVGDGGGATDGTPADGAGGVDAGAVGDAAAVADGAASP